MARHFTFLIHGEETAHVERSVAGIAEDVDGEMDKPMYLNSFLTSDRIK